MGKWPISRWKYAQHHNTVTCHPTPTGTAATRKTDRTRAGKGGRNWDPSTRLVGTGNGAAAVENSFLAVPQTNRVTT